MLSFGVACCMSVVVAYCSLALLFEVFDACCCFGVVCCLLLFSWMLIVVCC